MAEPDCPCNVHAETMDCLGHEWHEQNLETIVDGLQGEATERVCPSSASPADGL